MKKTAMACLAWVLALLGPQDAWAREKGKLAVAPLAVIGGLGNRDEALEQIFLEEVAKQGAEISDMAEARRFLERQPGGSCLTNEDCLGRLVASVHAAAALVVSVAPYSDSVIVNARLVGPDGRVLSHDRQATSNPTPGALPVEVVRKELQRALETLQLGSLPEAALAPVRPVEGGASRWVSYGVMAAGVASAGAGTVFMLQAGGDAERLRQRLDAQGRRLEGDLEAESLRTGIGRKDVASSLLLGAGGAALIAGAALYWNSSPAPVRVTAAGAPGSVGVIASGSF